RRKRRARGRPAGRRAAGASGARRRSGAHLGRKGRVPAMPDPTATPLSPQPPTNRGSPSPRWRPPRRLRITREGWFYVLFTLGVGAAAINTGNNLLYLVLGLQLSTIVISGVLSESCLRGLELET